MNACGIDGEELLCSALDRADILDVPVRVAAGRADRHRVQGKRRHGATRIVVDAHHRSDRVCGRGGREKSRLGIEVILHRRVEVEVVTRQVGEAADREFDPVDASEAQRMAGHLHHHCVDALLQHQRQQGLQIGRLGCGQRARQVLARNPDAHCADQARDPLRRPQSRLHQICGGGLARRPGHPDHPQVRRRVAVDGGGEPAKHRPRVGADQHGHGHIGAHVGQAV